MTEHNNLPATLTQSNSLADLAARICAEHEAAAAALNDGLQHAMAAGQLLLEAKKQIEHGDWLAWVEKNCAMTIRTAQAYMRVARSFKGLGANTQRVAHLSFRDALKALAKTSSMASRLPAEFVDRTLDDIERGDQAWSTAMREQAMRKSFSLESPERLLPAPDAKRKISVARNRDKRQWMLAIGPSISRSALLQKEQDARAAPTVVDLQAEHDDLLAQAAELEEQANALREDSKYLKQEIDAEIDSIIGPVQPLTETYTFQADKQIDAELVKLPQGDLVDRLMAALSQPSKSLKIGEERGDVGYWGDMNLRGAMAQVRPLNNVGWTGVGSPDWLNEIFGAAFAEDGSA